MTLNDKKVFDKFYLRLRKEGIIKSAIGGLIVGFAVMFVVALISWLVGFDGGFLLALGLFAAVSAGLGVALYFFKFKPTTKQIARRVDELGLEERTVTMLELENDNSWLAMRQREDARERLVEVGSKSLKITLSTAMIALIAVFGVLGLSMTTVLELSALDIVPSGIEIVDPNSRYDFVSVSYFVEEGGDIDGEADQIIERGENATSVMAVAYEGWMFVGWDDGVVDAYREDLHVTDDLFVMALFEPIGGGDDDGKGDQMGNGEGESGDVPGDNPGGSDNGGDDGGDAESGDGTGDGKGEVNGNGNGGTEGIQGGNGQGSGAGGKYNPSNQIIDGNTYYGDALEDYRAQLEEILSSNKELTDADKAFIEKYFGGL